MCRSEGRRSSEEEEEKAVVVFSKQRESHREPPHLEERKRGSEGEGTREGEQTGIIH